MKYKSYRIAASNIMVFLLFSVGSISAQPKGVVVETKESHFLFPSFEEGFIKMKSRQMVKANLDYNKATQEMIFEKGGNRLAMENLDKIDTVFLQDYKFVPYGKVFYEVAVDGHISLFIQHKCNIISKGKNTGYGTSQTTGAVSYTELMGTSSIYKFELPKDYYVTDITQYWLRKDGELKNIYNERKFLKVFPEKEKEIKEFIKANKIKVKEPKDLIKLVKYCNQLYE